MTLSDIKPFKNFLEQTNYIKLKEIPQLSDRYCVNLVWCNWTCIWHERA